MTLIKRIEPGEGSCSHTVSSGMGGTAVYSPPTAAQVFNKLTIRLANALLRAAGAK